MNFAEKKATVEYEPDKTTLHDVMAALMRTNQYTATLAEPVKTALADGAGAWSGWSDQAEYAAEGKGKVSVQVELKGDLEALTLAWKGVEGLTIEGPSTTAAKVSGKGSWEATFTLGKDVKAGELVAMATIEYTSASGKGTLTLPVVVQVK